MKKYILLLFLFICQISFAQISPLFNGDTTNYIDPNGLRQGAWFITGQMKKDLTYKPQSIVEEGYYLDNKKTGVWKTFYPNGNKKSEMTFVNNRPNGHAVFYDMNGNKTEEGTWVGTRWVGPYALFYPGTGIVRDSIYYSQLGQQIKYVEFDSAGKNPSVIPNQDKPSGYIEQQNGWVKEYDECGNVMRERFYVDGVPDTSKTIIRNIFPCYSYSGSHSQKQNNWNGEGQMTLYKNGQITMKGNFHNGKLVDGEDRIYDSNGLLVQIKLYKDGKYIGDGPIPDDANK